MSSIERELFLPPEVKQPRMDNVERRAEGPVMLRGRERLFAFWQLAHEVGAVGVLDERSRRITEAYSNPPFPTLDSLKEGAGVTTRERVRQLIKKGIAMIWVTMPPELQQQYPLEELQRTRVSPEARARMSEAHKGRTHSPETRARMSQARKGRPSPMAGRQHSPETRAKMSEAHKGRSSPMAGRQHSPEARARMSKALKGRTHSPEARAKMSEAHKETWRKRREQAS